MDEVCFPLLSYTVEGGTLVLISQAFPPSLPLLPKPPRVTRSGSRRLPDLPACDAAVYPHLCPDGKRNRNALRAEPSLSVLFVAGLGHTLCALEKRVRAGLGCRAVGSARVGMECVSEHD